MTIPGFVAEASLYKTNNHYRLAAGGSILSDGNTTVVPQDCGFFKGFVCSAGVGVATLLCAEACLAGPVACIGCIATALVALGIGGCFDCVPFDDIIGDGGGSGGGGGGGGDGCCPRGQRCCGSCASGKCDDACIGPGQVCP